MGRLGRVKSYTATTVGDDNVGEATIDTGGGAITTAQHFEPCGDDARPLPDDIAIVVPVPGEGRAVAIAFIDPNNDQLAENGEKRIYARDSDGASVCEIHLKSDGSININSTAALNINGLTIDASGNLTTSGTVKAGTVEGTGSVIADGKELVLHTHGTGAVIAGTTGPNN